MLRYNKWHYFSVSLENLKKNYNEINHALRNQLFEKDIQLKQIKSKYEAVIDEYNSNYKIIDIQHLFNLSQSKSSSC